MGLYIQECGGEDHYGRRVCSRRCNIICCPNCGHLMEALADMFYGPQSVFTYCKGCGCGLHIYSSNDGYITKVEDRC